LLITASWIENLKTELGLTGVAQVWGDRPSWYFWVTDAPGVFHLEFANADTVTTETGTFYTADFIIKCYPYPRHSLFKTFSSLEKALVQSPFFDNTHSPAFEYREQLPPDLFNIATMAITVDASHQIIRFGFETFDLLRTVCLHDTVRRHPELNQRYTLKAGTVDRNVPAMHIGYPFFGRMLCLHAYAAGKTPARIQLARRRGFEFGLDSETVRFIPSNIIQHYRYGVWFHPLSKFQTGDPDQLPATTSNEAEKILYDRAFPCGHFHPSQAEKELPLPLDDRWWALAHARYASHLTSCCGCN